MRRLVTPIISALITVGVVIGGVSAQNGIIPLPDPTCQPFGTTHLLGQMYPTAGLEPEFPIWCYAQPPAGQPTRALAGNQWVDNFDNAGPAIQSFSDHAYGYRVFDQLIARHDRFKLGYFVNTDHWMVDLVDVSLDRLSGGVMVSPDQTFQFENGQLVIEVDAAAGSDAMGGANRFYEIDVSSATQTAGYSRDDLYGYGQFGTAGGLGCRLERNDQGGNFVCAMYDQSGRATDGRCADPAGCPTPDLNGRVWETQGVGNALTGATIRGGFPEYVIPGAFGLRLRDVWRQCAANVHDLHCRDRFRMELTRDSLHMYVNGYQAMTIDGLAAVNPEGRDARLPGSWIQNGLRPYFTSWVNGGQHQPIRWHWDRIAVNSHDASGNFAAPSASPSFCLGNTFSGSPNTCDHGHTPGQPEVGPAGPTPVPPTPTPAPVPPTPTPTPTPATPVSTCEVRVRINGVEQWLSRPLSFCQ
jgi:hypothetical protein